jgi:hypothetical protein
MVMIFFYFLLLLGRQFAGLFDGKLFLPRGVEIGNYFLCVFYWHFGIWFDKQKIAWFSFSSFFSVSILISPSLLRYLHA